MKRIRALVVEDEEIVAKDIGSQLRAMGCGIVHTSSSGEEAIRKALKLRPDLVIMDIVLKGRIDGITAAEEISKFEIPVIYLTSFADADTLSRAKLTKPYGYIVKPFKEDDLRAAVEVALFRHREEKGKKQGELLLKSVLFSARSAVIIADAGMTIIFINRAAEHLTGWKREEALKQKLAEVFRFSGDRDCSSLSGLLASGSGKGLTRELELLGKDGTKRKILTDISSVSDTEGGIAGFVISCHALGENAGELAPLSKTLHVAYNNLISKAQDNKVAAILKAISFIEHNLGERISLEQIARTSNMSKYHFSRVFKDLEGTSPMSFVNFVKMESAAELLKYSSLSISETAYSVGFNSISHFTGQFRKIFGVTPSEYRSVAEKTRVLN